MEDTSHTHGIWDNSGDTTQQRGCPPGARGTYSSFLRVLLVRRARAMAGPPSLLMEFSRRLGKDTGLGRNGPGRASAAPPQPPRSGAETTYGNGQLV